MANGYDAQWRVPRREGQKTSKGMQNLQELLGITGGIAGRVQQNRDRRDDAQLSYLNSLTAGFENNYSSESINVMMQQLNDYKAKNIDNMSSDSLDFFNIAETRIGQHSKNLQEYDTQVGAIDALPDKAITLIEDLSAYGGLGEEAKDAYRNENWKNEDGTDKSIEEYDEWFRKNKQQS